MADLDYARLISKSSTGVPTIPPSPSHDNGDWDENDIYEFELYFDDADPGKLYSRWGGTVYLLNPDPVIPPSTNLYNTDDALTGPRQMDMDGYTLAFLNGSQFKVDSVSPPPVGEGSIDLTGYGTLYSDISHSFSTGSGVAMQIHGDNMITAERMLIQTPTGGSYGLGITADGDYGFQITNSGTSGIGIAADFQGNSNSRALRVVNNKVGAGNGLEGTGANIGVFGFGGTYGLAGQGVNGGIAYSTGGGWGWEVLQSVGVGALKTDGKVRHTNLPVSATGLSAGDLYMDTAANILSNGDLIMAVKQ